MFNNYYIFISCLLILLKNTDGQTINNVRLVNHQDYMITVIQDTVKTVERKGWWNLKLPDVEVFVNETVIDWEVLGSATYTKGFLVSIQHVDILQTSVQQVWSRTTPGLVDVRGRLRMHNLVVGYDAGLNLAEGNFLYSVTYMHPLVNFDFSVVKDLHQDTITVTVTGNTPNSNNVPDFLPKDHVSDMLTTLYVRTSSVAGINAWGPEIFRPIVDDLVTNVTFPPVCYDCSV